MAAACGPVVGQCTAVSGDRILGRDLAQAVPVFAGLPAELSLGYSPAPGSRRVYSHAELERLARRYGLELAPDAVACFSRPLETLTRERVEAAIRAELPQGRIELLEFSRQPTPSGELRFAMSGLDAVHGTDVQIWHGGIRQAGHDDFPVWAKVRVRIAGRRAIAVESLPAGQPITRSQLRLESYEGPPVPDISEIVGQMPRRTIPAGAAIRAENLQPVPDVQRGERVRVEVDSGRTRLRLEGQAQSSGRRGETITVRNPDTGKFFRAHVAHRGQVSVTLQGGL